jgi:alginate O-acetyltransferase complex protein AlgI
MSIDLVLLFAAVGAVLYWSFRGANLRIGALLALSCVLLFTQKASILYVALITVLTLATHWVASRPSPETPSDESSESDPNTRWQMALTRLLIVVLLVLFVVFKTDLRGSFGFAEWLGFSYITFRLLHVLIDRLYERYTDATGLQMVLYVFFFPALPVGPIDRLPHFLDELRASLASRFEWRFLFSGGLRILKGGVKKYFLADMLLSHLAVGTAVSANQGDTHYAWIQLYALAFYIYFDFSGFIDIALGTAAIFNIHLPENFNHPYLQRNVTQFWQSWHITLSSWVRSYVFLPLSRYLLKKRMNSRLVLFCAHLTTMLLIGMWHGITPNYAIWGLWHGLALFVHKLFADSTRQWHRRRENSKLNYVTRPLSIVLTFHFVAIGWLFFILPEPSDVFQFLGYLVGS